MQFRCFSSCILANSKYWRSGKVFALKSAVKTIENMNEWKIFKWEKNMHFNDILIARKDKIRLIKIEQNFMA